MPINLSVISLDRSHSIPLSRQLYGQLHQQILHGAILFKERLPASRALAARLNLSRGVIVECYDMLKIDRLVAGFGKGGTQVCYRNLQPTKMNPSTVSGPALSQRGKMICSARMYSQTLEEPLPLTASVPDFSLFPVSRWHQLSKQAWQESPDWYQRDGGLKLLKKALQDFLLQYRGLTVKNPDCLLMTSGTQSALSLLARLLTEPGDAALVEQPCWPGSEAAMIQAGLSIIHAPVDDQGLNYRGWSDASNEQKPRIAITTPGIQFPTGRPMSMQRLELLLHHSASQNCWLIEDDYAAEYSFAQHPAPSIMSHSATDHVIHVGTMSKLLMPGIRLGWMVVPERIAHQVNNALNVYGNHPPYPLQQQLGLFMKYGNLSSHLAHTRTIYNNRRVHSSLYLQQHVKNLLFNTPSISGMNQYLRINQNRVDVHTLSQRLQKAQLGCDIYSQTIKNRKEYFLLLGHTRLNDQVIEEHLGKLVEVLNEKTR